MKTLIYVMVKHQVAKDMILSLNFKAMVVQPLNPCGNWAALLTHDVITPQRGNSKQSTRCTYSGRHGKTPRSAHKEISSQITQRGGEENTPYNTRLEYKCSTHSRTRSGHVEKKTPRQSQGLQKKKTPRSSHSEHNQVTDTGSNQTAAVPRRVLFDMHKKRKPHHWRLCSLHISDHSTLDAHFTTSAILKSSVYRECYEPYGEITRKGTQAGCCLKKQLAEKSKFKLLFTKTSIQCQKRSSFGVRATADEQDRCDKLAAIWIAKSSWPFTIVNDKYFRKYSRKMNSVQGYVRVIKPWKVREDVETIAGELRDTLKAKIGLECVYYSASTDIWTSQSQRGFISFTLHYLGEELKMYSWVLKVKVLPGKHDALIMEVNLDALHVLWIHKQVPKSGGVAEFDEEESTAADEKLKDKCESAITLYLGDAQGTPVTTNPLKWWTKERRGKPPL
ncbi:Hypothetical protein PHPALM_14161 [Phytophthora palmivora]|uniref:Uncharacterized protein n=1 Tax=Phytophthora palmivora TaxID=4796 RepID=A0A2P4XVG5_9STRA|nr:Hypothetical protein PHPALM_14161 [Phytophthora palmivora]